MITYLTAFIFYTLAMVGVLLVGFVVYKKTQLNQANTNKGMIKIIDSIAIAPKKMLLVVKVKNEKFLIASGAEHTTFLSKLDDSETPKAVKKQEPIIKQQLPIQNIQAKKEQNFADPIKTHKSLAQKQFEKLMEQEDIQEMQKPNKLASNRKEMLKALLEDLSNDYPKVGSGF